MSGYENDLDTMLAQLTEFALGLLPPDAHDRVAARVAATPELARELAGIRETLAALDEIRPPRVPSSDLRARVLGSADPGRRFEGFVARMTRLFDFSAERARDVLAAIDDARAAWEAPGIPGVRLFHFDGGPSVASADCGLVEIAPGVDFPAHAHHGDEWSLNLQGRAVESTGQIFEPGDLVHRPPGGHHSFRSIGDEAYVFAVVLYGGFHPDGGVDRTD